MIHLLVFGNSAIEMIIHWINILTQFSRLYLYCHSALNRVRIMLWCEITAMESHVCVHIRHWSQVNSILNVPLPIWINWHCENIYTKYPPHFTVTILPQQQFWMVHCISCAYNKPLMLQLFIPSSCFGFHFHRLEPCN